jgi:hypothetical protein
MGGVLLRTAKSLMLALAAALRVGSETLNATTER